MTIGRVKILRGKNQWKRNQSNINATLFSIQMARGQDGGIS